MGGGNRRMFTWLWGGGAPWAGGILCLDFALRSIWGPRGTPGKSPYISSHEAVFPTLAALLDLTAENSLRTNREEKRRGPPSPHPRKALSHFTDPFREEVTRNVVNR